MRRKVYIETTIPSYLVARPTRDLIVAAHQELTRQWWSRRRRRFDLFISQFVLNEASGGQEDLARQRLRFLEGIPLLEAAEAVGDLAEDLVRGGAVAARAAADAAHIAVAAVHEMDFLMTWNCAHLANAVTALKIREVCQSQGYASPEICTPEELMEG